MSGADRRDAAPRCLAAGCLEGQAIFVTGAGTGIGQAIALRLAALGATVGGCGRREEPLAETAHLIGEAGGRFLWSACDVTDAEAGPAALRAFAEAEGLTGLVNNAGGQFSAPAEAIRPRGWQAVMELNLNAVFRLTQAAYPYLAAAGGGSVVNISIGPVERGALGLAHSVAARSGVSGLARCLALEWGGKGVRVNCLAAGAVATEALEAKLDEALGARLLADTPLGRFLSAEEVAETAAFLLSPAAAMLTGQIIRLDGGAFLAGPVDFLPQEAMAS